MTKVGSYIINETLIKFATPYFTLPKDGGMVNNYPLPATRIVFFG